MNDKNINLAPNCVGIIMDGNRRWAKEKGLSVIDGHKEGYEKLKEVVGWSKEVGVRTVIAYAFSTENWNRVETEVNYLLKLFKTVLIDEGDELKKQGFKVKFIGDIGKFPKEIQSGIKKMEDETSHFGDNDLLIAVSYGGRLEIVEAVKKLSLTKTKEEIEGLTEVEFSNYLYTAGFCDPDLIIRTGGEERLSNFLPWQSVYSEFYFSKTYWPAFGKEEFLKILDEYSGRERRRGK